MLRVLYIDMNSYFASVEQHLDPALRGKPVAVAPVHADSGTCIAASFEAKAFGVRTGTRVGDARRLCPGIIITKGSFDTYIRIHHQIIEAVETVLPVQAVHSVDEVSCRLLGVQRRPEEAQRLAIAVKRAITSRIGECLTCSIGVAPNRFIAKIAADMKKPDGLTIIQAHELPQRLYELRLIDLPGIGRKMEAHLLSRGIRTIEHLCALDEDAIRAVWGSVIGAAWYYRLRGQELVEPPTYRRSISHSHVLAPKLRESEGARAVCVRLIHKTASRARHLGYVAEHMTLSIKPIRGKTWHARATLGGAEDTPTMMRAFAELWEKRPGLTPLRVGVVLHDLTPRIGATPLLFEQTDHPAALSKAIDAINRKYGSDTVYSASMHEARKSAPRRIAFGNIPDLDTPDVSDERPE